MLVDNATACEKIFAGGLFERRENEEQKRDGALLRKIEGIREAEMCSKVDNHAC